MIQDLWLRVISSIVKVLDKFTGNIDKDLEEEREDRRARRSSYRSRRI